MPDVSLENRTEQKIAAPKSYTVRMHNDDFTPFDFVIAVLMQIYNKSESEASDIAVAIHNDGSKNVGIYTLDIAQTKVRITTSNAQQNGYPLKATIEEA